VKYGEYDGVACVRQQIIQAALNTERRMYICTWIAFGQKCIYVCYMFLRFLGLAASVGSRRLCCCLNLSNCAPCLFADLPVFERAKCCLGESNSPLCGCVSVCGCRRTRGICLSWAAERFYLFFSHFC